MKNREEWREKWNARMGQTLLVTMRAMNDNVNKMEGETSRLRTDPEYRSSRIGHIQKAREIKRKLDEESTNNAIGYKMEWLERIGEPAARQWLAKNGLIPSDQLVKPDERKPRCINFKTMLYHHQDKKCAACKDTFKMNEMHIDHITPLASRGTDDDCNLQLLCVNCNGVKGAQPISNAMLYKKVKERSR